MAKVRGPQFNPGWLHVCLGTGPGREVRDGGTEVRDGGLGGRLGMGAWEGG